MRETPNPAQPEHNWKTRLRLAAALTWIMLCLILLGYRLTLPTDGWMAVEPDEFDSNGFIYRQNVIGLPSGLQPGDWVTEIYGEPILNGLYIAPGGFETSWRVGNTLDYTVLREGQPMSIQVPLGRWSLRQVLGATVYATPASIFTWFGLIIFLLVSCYAYWRRPIVLAAEALMFQASFLFSIFLTLDILPPLVSDVLDPVANFGVVFTTLLTFSLLLPPALIRFGLTFPQVKPVLRKHSWVGFLPYLVGAGVIAAFAMRVYVAGWLWTGVAILITIGLLIHNGLTMRDSISRGQMRWALGGTVLGLGLFSATFLNFLFVGFSGNSIGQLLSALSNLGFPVMGIGLSVAILRYQLFNIDRVVNRALVYFGLTLSVISFYILVVGYMSYLFQAQGSLLISLAATGVVAVLFEPLRRGLQRAVNRLMYGERDEPYELLMRLGQQVESALDSSSGLALIVETVAKALKLPYIALSLSQENRMPMQVAAQYGTPQTQVVKFPLLISGQPIGELWVAARSLDETFSQNDMRLLGSLARQISATAYAHLLGLRLEQARLRLVTERGEARRQLGRDLHDDVGHQLTALVQQLDRLKRGMQLDPFETEATVHVMNQQLVNLTTHVRELAHQLFPPELELLGLVGALRERSLSHPNLKIFLDAPDDLPVLPAEIETVVYYITLEALTNIEKHAQAQSCSIHIKLLPSQPLPNIELTIRDDGRGMALPPLGGMGLLSMQARAAEVGGTFKIDILPGAGTTITVQIPYPSTIE